jgi:hypothetical protein
MKIKHSGGPGTDKQNAIKIIGARNNMEGVAAEHKLIGKYLRQELIRDGDMSYDRIVLQDGSVVWFDITDFYGKA